MIKRQKYYNDLKTKFPNQSDEEINKSLDMLITLAEIVYESEKRKTESKNDSNSKVTRIEKD